jgi:hypothetical protein
MVAGIFFGVIINVSHRVLKRNLGFTIRELSLHLPIGKFFISLIKKG